jgi:hypothetical protein
MKIKKKFNNKMKYLKSIIMKISKIKILTLILMILYNLIKNQIKFKIKIKLIKMILIINSINYKIKIRNYNVN